MKYDLEKRMVEFSKRMITFTKELRKKEKHNKDIDFLLNQLFRSITSIGANYMEANNSCSKNCF